MGKVIRLAGDIHQQVQSLLPWYVNATLEEDEAAAVEAHLAECVECRRALVGEKTLGVEVSLASMDIDQGWAAMRRRIAGETGVPAVAAPRPAHVVPLRRQPFLRRPVPMGWAIGAQAAALLLVFGGLQLRHAVSPPMYHALGSAPLPAAGNVIVIFKPEATERAMRDALAGNHATMVGGPTDSNAYVLHVDVAQRPGGHAAGRPNDVVTLAEPVDGPVAP
jgi:hypothetical protein